MPTAPTHTAEFESIRLSGDWQVESIPLDAELTPTAAPGKTLRTAECTHLQPALYPNQPYWGDDVRAINHHAWVYRRPIPALPREYKRARLHFEGVDYFADVWVNDQRIGQHEGHFAPFEFDVTPFLDARDSMLTVRVSAPWDTPNPSGTYPTDHVFRSLVKGLYEHGEGVIPPAVNPIGIWRPVWLLLDQGVSIDHVRIHTDLDGRVDLRLRIANSTAELWHGTLQLDIAADNHDGAGMSAVHPLALPPGVQTFDCVLHIPEPRLWWSWDQGAPNLYSLDARLVNANSHVISAARESFGVRTVHLERSSERFTYWLNERPVFLRGASYMPSVYLSQCSENTMSHDVALARAANLNLLRLHVHVSPPELYRLCDHMGMLIWQDFELNWIQDTTPEFETRARTMQRDMIDLLGNHPSIITWACHNEPTMLFTRRHNLERHPDPALYADACQQDPTRPVFICSGQLEDDWQRAGDSHSYYGAIWSQQFTDIHPHRPRLNTEFGFETPAALDTLRIYPEVWARLQHLEEQIDDLWAYQAALIQYQVEHFRRLRTKYCAGYIYFWLVDLVPQVGCGVLDAQRIPKSGYEALRRASQPLQVALEHDGRRPTALWLFNDTPCAYPGAVVRWQVDGFNGQRLLDGETCFDLQANTAQCLMPVRWSIAPKDCAQITLHVYQASGEPLCENHYRQPFHPPRRPSGYPWKFDPYLGTKVFNRHGAPSLADQSANGLVKQVPLWLREMLAEWMFRQRLPNALLSKIARLVDAILE